LLRKREVPMAVAAERTDGAGTGFTPYSERTYHAMAETFRALADPTRARIVHILSFGERSVNDIAQHLSVSPSAVSHQLRMLRQLGLVRFRREAQQAFYALDDPHVAILFQEAFEHVDDFLQEGKKRREWL
jgi:DNA-binding transcriptional ArsR family regulator